MTDQHSNSFTCQLSRWNRIRTGLNLYRLIDSAATVISNSSLQTATIHEKPADGSAMNELTITIPICSRGDMLRACLERRYHQSMLYSTLRSICLSCFSFPEGWRGHRGRRRKIPLMPPSSKRQRSGARQGSCYEQQISTGPQSLHIP